MAVETKFVVTRDGKEIGVFATLQEAEAFEVVTERTEKLAVLLTATAHEHQLDMEAIERVARTLAQREKDMASLFSAPIAKGKGKNARGARAAKGPRKPKHPAGVTTASSEAEVA